MDTPDKVPTPAVAYMLVLMGACVVVLALVGSRGTWLVVDVLVGLVMMASGIALRLRQHP